MPTLAAQNWSVLPEGCAWREICQTAEMFNLIPKVILVKRGLCLLLVGTLNLPAADQSLPVRGFCIASPSGNRVDEFIKFIEEELAPRSVNVLILRVDYSFQFLSRPEMADKNGLSKEQAQKLSAACKRHQIRIIPLVNLLGHQSWQSHCGKLLKAHPEFDETPEEKFPEKYAWPNPDTRGDNSTRHSSWKIQSSPE